MVHRQHRPRSCARCGTRLARDNTDHLCAACRVKARDYLIKPPTLPRAFWLHDHLRDALDSWHFGHLIAAYRSHPHHGRVLTQQTVAGWLNLTQAQLSRIESGHAPEELGKLTHWAIALGVPGDLLWFKLPSEKTQRPTGERGIPVQTAIPRPGAAAALRTATPATTQKSSDDAVSERVSHALQHPGSIDFVTVAHLRRAVQELDEQYLSLPSTSLLADTGRYLGWISFLSPKATNGRVRRELCAVEAEAAVLMGQLVWDASQRRDHHGARRYYDQAIEASRRARDPLIEGLALLRKSMVALYGDKKPRDGLALALQTADTTAPVSDVLTGLATLHAAEAHALLGARVSCERALAAAEARFDSITADDEAVHQYSPTQFGRMAGSCYLALNQPKRAEHFLQTTAASFDGASKPQTIVLGNLALAGIRQGKLDEGVRRLHEAIDVIERNRSGGGLNIVFGAGRELRPWRTSPVVHDVYDRLLSLTAAK